MVMKRTVKTQNQAPKFHVVAKCLLGSDERIAAWGTTTFENDDASDWLYDLEESKGFSILEDALELEDGYLEASNACYALSAAEIVLALIGRARDGIPETAVQWASVYQGTDVSALHEMAISAVDRVLSEESELLELWKDTDDFQLWKSDVEEIAALLK